jgi:hypothetical protein
LNDKIISSLLDDINGAMPEWDRLVEISFLPNELKDRYRLVLEKRRDRLLR